MDTTSQTKETTMQESAEPTCENQEELLVELVWSMNDTAARIAATEEMYSQATQMFSRALALVRRNFLMEEMETERGGTRSQPRMQYQSSSAITPQELAVLRQEYIQDHEQESGVRGAHTTSHEPVASGRAGTMNENMSTLLGEPDEGNFVFRHIILSHQQIITQNTSVFETISFTLMYNMAICLHLNSIRNDSQQEGRRNQVDVGGTWMKSLRLYELTYQMQVLSDRVEVPLVYVCGILNNLAHVHSRLGNKVASQHCRSNLLSILMYYVAVGRSYYSEERSTRSTELMEMYLSHFFGVVSHTITCCESPNSTAEAA